MPHIQLLRLLEILEVEQARYEYERSILVDGFYNKTTLN